MARQSKNPPAFQFYPEDFDSGTVLFNNEQVGAYVRALNYQWVNGGLPSESENLAKIFRCSRKVAARLFFRISEKFVRGDDGLWRNPRLELVREEQRYHADISHKGGVARARSARRKGGRFSPAGTPADTPADEPGEHQPSDLHTPVQAVPSELPVPPEVQNSGCAADHPVENRKRGQLKVGGRQSRLPSTDGNVKVLTKFVHTLLEREPNAGYADLSEEVKRACVPARLNILADNDTIARAIELAHLGRRHAPRAVAR